MGLSRTTIGKFITITSTGVMFAPNAELHYPAITLIGRSTTLIG
jgi:hypothetical protein